jgi:hypothetical protein
VDNLLKQKEICMLAATPVNPPDQMQPTSTGLPAESPRGARITSHFLRTFSFHLLAVILGIALALM